MSKTRRAKGSSLAKLSELLRQLDLVSFTGAAPIPRLKRKRANLDDKDLVEPVGIEPTTSSLQS